MIITHMYMEPQSLEVPHSLLAHHRRIAVPERDAQRELCYREVLVIFDYAGNVAAQRQVETTIDWPKQGNRMG
jgi:hypothetical protein